MYRSGLVGKRFPSLLQHAQLPPSEKRCQTVCAVKFLVKGGFAKNTPQRWTVNDSRASIHPNQLTLESVHLLQLCMDFGS